MTMMQEIQQENFQAGLVQGIQGVFLPMSELEAMLEKQVEIDEA